MGGRVRVRREAVVEAQSGEQPAGGQRPCPAPYAFGDSRTEARRLDLVDQVFGPPSRTLLARAPSQPPALAYDLGCGPGHTTRLVAEVTRSSRTVGLDRSEAHLARARRGAPPGVDFAVHDVSRLPFPAGTADLIYSRLVLAHLPAPLPTARAWSTQLRPGGVLVLDELEWIRTDHPVLGSHVALAVALVASAGAQMYAGPRLSEMGDTPGLRRRLAEVVELAVPTATAATMFAMSLAAWRERVLAAGLRQAAELDELAKALDALQGSPATGEITWGLHQAVYERLA